MSRESERKVVGRGSRSGQEFFDGDRPIKGDDEDRFGFGMLADRIADALTLQAAGKGFVFGIEGKWGSGKSSLLSLTLNRLRKLPDNKVAVIEFRPWLVGDRDQLLTSLFDDFAKAIAGLEYAGGDATGVSKLAATDVAAKVKRFANHLGPIGKVAGLAGVLVPGATLAGDILERIAAAAREQTGGPTLAEQKEDLSVSLQKLDCRIIVAIDDVDRLEPNEVAELLRLVRSVADFPNVSYLLCYDAETLARSLEKATGVPNGAAYLEKIVQTEVAVPRPESFALRRWFSNELQLFAQCPGHRIPHLQYVIDETGGRVLGSPRSVVRVLDSLRFYWPSLRDKVDLADLVWLRLLAVGAPSLFRWIEEYLVAHVSLTAGRVHISEHERATMTQKLDRALEFDGLDWDQICFELERHLPGIETHNFNNDKDERIFSRAARISSFSAANDRRLASASHTKLYFTLVQPVDSVTDSDIAELLEAGREGPNAVAFVLLKMGAQLGDAGASKAEKLLDQLRFVESEVLQGWPIEALLVGLANSADELAKHARSDDWGYPRLWNLARKLLKNLKDALPNDRFEASVKDVFELGTSMGFVSYLLRNETFAHGVYGDRPNPNDRLLSRDSFDAIRHSMMRRYFELGLDRILEEKPAATILYAWSQGGGRDDLVSLIKERESDNEWLVGFLNHLFGPNSSLSLDALSNFFESPAAVVRRVKGLAQDATPFPGAKAILDSVKASMHFEGGDFEAVLEAWEQRERGKSLLTE